jgi:hypothetical protein
MPDQIGPALDAPLPDVIEPIVGYRRWRGSLSKGLQAEHRDFVFPIDGGPLQAQCDPVYYSNGPTAPMRPHQAPSHPGMTEHGEHGCGIYAYATWEDAWRNFSTQSQGVSSVWGDPSPRILVYGEVQLWGTVWPHEHGYRAEYAKPSCLYIMGDEELTVVGKSMVEMLGEAYGVPVVDCPMGKEERDEKAEARRKEANMIGYSNAVHHINPLFNSSIFDNAAWGDIWSQHVSVKLNVSNSANDDNAWDDTYADHITITHADTLDSWDANYIPPGSDPAARRNKLDAIKNKARSRRRKK